MTDTVYGVGSFPGPIDANAKFFDAEAVFNGVGSDAIDLGSGFKPRPALPVNIVFDVVSIDETTGDETYQFTLQQRDETTDDWESTGLVVTLSKAGIASFTAGVKARYVRLLPSIAGTTPEIALSAWIAPA